MSHHTVATDLDAAIMRATAIAVIKTTRGISAAQKKQLLGELNRRFVDT